MALPGRAACVVSIFRKVSYSIIGLKRQEWQCDPLSLQRKFQMCWLHGYMLRRSCSLQRKLEELVGLKNLSDIKKDMSSMLVNVLRSLICCTIMASLSNDKQIFERSFVQNFFDRKQ
ncbi:hypothetical protein O6H91_01G027200 [Diphasiastrum complanatum]|uniref:Uncharacterized protein n=1 Tax=Diphasiastrum complanatum TaxID=34168 RepID=A0ACC2EPD8_DIPCM|nr:hypothetical protein O6H91_01G027200 [Diphasiastrum complanatum]